MRKFSSFLFENFDPAAQAENPQNPRRFLNGTCDCVFSRIAQVPAGTCHVSVFHADTIQTLVQGGILRLEGDAVLFDTPVFLKEDTSILRETMQVRAGKLVALLLPVMSRIRECLTPLDNGFPAEVNLYHILCGMVFDGLFFDCLSNRNVVATSRPHPSGLDYLSVIYERCPELDSLSDGLLCSYNCFTDGRCSLQSFGDSNGNRLDFYRFSRLLESGTLPPQWEHLRPDFETYSRSDLLSQVRELIITGRCEAKALSLLTEFGYVSCGHPCVPVFTGSAFSAAEQIEKIVQTQCGDAFAEALSPIPELTAAKHGVNPKEIANELYHILFGSVNEKLIAEGLAASPPHIPGEGRYLKCIQLDI